MCMSHSITNTIRVIAGLLKRDVRDLFKTQGIIVDDEFLDELRKTIHKTDVGQAVTPRTTLA